MFVGTCLRQKSWQLCAENMTKFLSEDLKGLWRPKENSAGEDNGQVTIIGGSSLFQGAPLLSVLALSRMVDMVFVATPEEDKEIVAKTELFSRLRSVMWIPREDIDDYIAKSDAVLIGPGMMRWHREGNRESEVNTGNEAGAYTKRITGELLARHSQKRWVIDGGSLQTMEVGWIPKGAVLTPNNKEYELMFGTDEVAEAAGKHGCVIVYKGPVAYVSDGEVTYEIIGGNAGLTKGGTGDVLAGVIAGLLAKNPPLVAAAAGTYLVKMTAERLFERVGYGFNADDLAQGVFETKKNLVGY